jgi:serine/threonine protein kinase
MGPTTFNLVGQNLAGGRYAVQSRLDEGGMALVYLALDRTLQTNVVIKVPRLSLTHEDDFGPRFEREIGSLVKLLHPNVCRILDVGRFEDVPFVVLPYLGGGNLSDHRAAAADGTPLPTPPSSLHRWLSQIAAALDYIHGQSYVHRDVKPGNILFDEHGYPYLGDFGVAKVLGDDAAKTRPKTLTQTGMTLGTPQYMAPELIMGQAIDGRIDQYALAVTVFEILSGRFPFDGSSPGAIIVAATTQKSPSLADMNLGISNEVALAVRRGLARHADDRFKTCEAFARAVLAGVPETPSTAFAPAKRRGAAAASSKMSLAAGTRPSETYLCPKCGTHFRLKSPSGSGKAKCPGCRGIVRVGPSDPERSSAPSAVVPVQTGLHETESQLSATTLRALGKRRPENKPAPNWRKPPLALTISVAVALAVVVGSLLVAFQVSRHEVTSVATVPPAAPAKTSEMSLPVEKVTTPVAAVLKPQAPGATEPANSVPRSPLLLPKQSVLVPTPSGGDKMVVRVLPNDPQTQTKSDDARIPEPPVREPVKNDKPDVQVATSIKTANKTSKPRADASLSNNEEVRLFQQGLELIDVRNFKEAESTLAKASKADPKAIEADFTLGILSLISDSSPGKPSKARFQKAQIHFQAVLKRRPGYVPALNNLAVTFIRQAKFPEAMHSLQDALARSPDSEEVTHNILRFFEQAKRPPIRKPVKQVLSNYSKLYAKVAAAKGTSTGQNFGWRYIPLTPSDGESEIRSTVLADRRIYDDRACPVCNGSGSVPCSAGCQHGHFYSERTANNAINIGSSRNPIMSDNPTTTTIQSTCSTCGGTGIEECHYCHGSRIDPHLGQGDSR